MISLLKDALAILGTYKAIVEFGPKIVNEIKSTFKKRYYDVHEILPNLIGGTLSLGDTIESTGFLTRYSQTFLPMSYAPSIPNKAKEQIKSQRFEHGKLVNYCELNTKWGVLQVPITIIPSHNNLRLCFLYRDDFSGFIHPVSDKKDSSDSNTIVVPDNGKPIPVLIDITKHSFAMDQYVYLKGKLIAIPDALAQNLSTIYTDVLFEHNNSFYDPYSPVGTFVCISLLDDESVELQKKGQPEVKGLAFAELHVEELEEYTDIAQEVISKSIPDLASQAVKIITVNGYESEPYITQGDIRVLYKKPSIIGLYSTVDVFDSQSYRQNISAMHRYSQVLSRNIQDNSFNAIGKRLKTKTDFVFDPSKAGLFDSRGVLNLAEKDLLKLNDPSARSTISWYKETR